MGRFEPKRFVVEAVVEKNLVVVALVPVALAKVKFWRVEEAVARNWFAESTVPSKVRFAESVKVPPAVM